MAVYMLIEDGHQFESVEAESAEEALEDLDPEATGSYDTSDGTVWTTIHAANVDDEDDSASREYTIHPTEPECSSGGGHDWQSPHEILGGLEENPGVWGHGGGVIIRECCMHCGCGRATDTWAQNPSNGKQGLESIRYEPGKYASEIAQEEAS